MSRTNQSMDPRASVPATMGDANGPTSPTTSPTRPGPRPTRSRTDPLPVRSDSFQREHSPNSKVVDDTNWFDVPLAFALVPALGSLLTGSDLLKDFLHLAFLLYYLHHLIKIPWELYMSARSRRSSSAAALHPDDHVRRLARSELRMAELTYLAFTIIAPFLGAVLLRTVSKLLSFDAISTFSTSLFILATGIRPWRHLIHLLQKRTESLHDAVHLPSDDSVHHRLDALEQQLGRIQDLLENREDETTEILGAANASLDIARKEIKRIEKTVDTARVASDVRFKELENTVEELKTIPLHQSQHHHQGPAPPYGSVVPSGPPSTTVSFTVPQSLADMVVKPFERLVAFASPPRKTRDLERDRKMATSAEIVEIDDDSEYDSFDDRKATPAPTTTTTTTGSATTGNGKHVTFAVVESDYEDDASPPQSFLYGFFLYILLSPVRSIRYFASVILDQLH